MKDAPKPTTAAEILALPKGPAFGIEERVINGVLYRCPVMMPVVCVFHDNHDVIFCSDEEGLWTLGRYADGGWFRRRIG